MKIADIETILLSGSNVNDYYLPTASYVSNGYIILKIYTDEGVVGVGEPSPYGGTLPDIVNVIKSEIRPRFIGKNPFDVELLTKQKEFSGDTGYGNVPYNSAIAGISMALWDIIGKALDVPVYILLNKNGNYKLKVRAYASGGMWYKGQDIQILVEEVIKFREYGYTAWKFRPETPIEEMSHFERNKNPPIVDIKNFIRLIEKIRISVGTEFDLMVDAGCRFTNLDDAIKVARALEEMDYFFFEEPMPRIIADYQKLCSTVKIPIAGGESLINRKQFRPWIENSAYDVIQPDGNLAGLTEVIAVSEIADKAGKPCIIHNWGNDISNVANVHLALAIPNCNIIEYNTTYNPLREKLVLEPMIPINGMFSLSDKPGLGINLNEDTIKRYCIET